LLRGVYKLNSDIKWQILDHLVDSFGSSTRLVKICIFQRLDGSASEQEGEFFVLAGGVGVVVGG
jgi:hypothetical protein